MRERKEQNRGTNWRQWDIEEKEECSRKEGEQRNKVETLVCRGKTEKEKYSRKEEYSRKDRKQRNKVETMV